MSDDLFNTSNDKPAAPVDTTPPAEGVVESLVGEGKKYKTIEDLAKSRLEADQFIERLKAETADMRKRIEEANAEKEEYEQRILKARQAAEQPAHKTEQVKPEEIAALVDQRIQDLEAQRGAQANLAKAQSELVEQFDGKLEEAKAYLQKRAADLGVSVDYLKEQATKSPSVFKALIGTKEAPAAPAASAAAVGKTSTSQVQAGVHGTREYYENLRKSNPSHYFSPAVQNEMFKLVKEGKLKLN